MWSKPGTFWSHGQNFQQFQRLVSLQHVQVFLNGLLQGCVGLLHLGQAVPQKNGFNEEAHLKMSSILAPSGEGTRPV